MLTEGRTAIQRRGQCKFPSPAGEDRPTVLTAYSPLVMVRMNGGTPPCGEFRHQMDAMDAPPLGEWKMLQFKDWWSELIYRASAALPGSPPGMIPINGSPSVAWKDRERLNRRLVIQTLRNHRGAHSLDEFPAIMDEIDGPDSWGGFGFIDESTGEEVSTDNGGLAWGAGQLAAMSREIAAETLVAFGRATLPSPT